MQPGYFSNENIVKAMPHDHLFIWMEMVSAIKQDLKAGCKVADFGCSSGELLRVLCAGVPNLIDPIKPAIAVGLELETMRDVLIKAASKMPSGLPIVLSSAPLHAFASQFDVILSHEVLYLVEDLADTFAAAFAALKAGGVLCAATAGYIENEYYQRWQSKFKKRGITVFNHSKDEYAALLKLAGFDQVQVIPILLTKQVYHRWRSERAFDDWEWFESQHDEERYFTKVGKLAFIARRTIG